MEPQTFSDWLVASLVFLFVSVIAATIFLGLWQFVHWLFCRRNLKRSLFGLACLATLIALFYAEEDWRGWHDWNQFKHQWEAKGEKFDFKDFVPPPVPDDQNFAFAPVVATSYAMYLDKSGHEIIPRNTNVVNRLQLDLVDYHHGGKRSATVLGPTARLIAATGSSPKKPIYANGKITTAGWRPRRTNSPCRRSRKRQRRTFCWR